MFIEHIPDPGCCSGYWEQKIRRGEEDLQESLSQVHPGIGPAGKGHPTTSFTLRGKSILGTERTSQNFSQFQSEILNSIGVPHGTMREMKATTSRGSTAHVYCLWLWKVEAQDQGAGWLRPWWGLLFCLAHGHLSVSNLILASLPRETLIPPEDLYPHDLS